jgi:hypothetical protein
MEWITDGSVPEYDEFKWVLVVVGDEVWPASWNDETQLWIFNDGMPAHTVDAWMEMPEWRPIESDQNGMHAT